MSNDAFWSAFPAFMGAAGYARGQARRRQAQETAEWNKLVTDYKALQQQYQALVEENQSNEAFGEKMLVRSVVAAQGQSLRDNLVRVLMARGRIQTTREEVAEIIQELMVHWDPATGEDLEQHTRRYLKDNNVPDRYLPEVMKFLGVGDGTGPNDLLNILFPEDDEAIRAHKEEQQQLQAQRAQEIQRLTEEIAQLQQEIQANQQRAQQQMAACDGDPNQPIEMEKTRKGLGKKYRVGERLFSIRDAALCYLEEQQQLRDAVRQLHARNASLVSRMEALTAEIQQLQSQTAATS